MANKKEAASEMPAPIVPTSYGGNSFQKKLLRMGLVLIFAGFVVRFWNQYQSKPETSGTMLRASKQQVKPAFPVCADSANVWVNEEQPVGRQTVRENCLSGIVYLPLETKFISDASGWAEYWFITPSGYKVIGVANRGAKFPRTKLPSCTFRIRGKRGTAKVQMELKNYRQTEYADSYEDNTEPIR